MLSPYYPFKCATCLEWRWAPSELLTKFPDEERSKLLNKPKYKRICTHCGPPN